MPLTTSNRIAVHLDMVEPSKRSTADSFMVGCCCALVLISSLIYADRIFVHTLSTTAEVLGHPYLGEDCDISHVRPSFEAACTCLVVNFVRMAISQVHTNKLEKGQSNHPVPADGNLSSPHLDAESEASEISC